jgi:hypothetical protein
LITRTLYKKRNVVFLPHTSLSFAERSLSIAEHSLSIAKRSLSIAKRSLSIAERSLSIAKRSLSIFDTRTPFTFAFDEFQRGKTVYFCLCGEKTRGEKGPWSEIISVIIP